MKILHYTLGVPAYREYRRTDHADLWWAEYESMNTPIEWWVGSLRPQSETETDTVTPAQFPWCAKKVQA